MCYAEQVNEWTAVLRLNLNGKGYLTVINVHSPTLEKVEERRQFYEALKPIYDKYKSDSLVYLAGDWNARAGRRQGQESCIGSFGSQCRNDAGDDLVAFCEARDLFLCNTAFKHKWSQRATWKSPTGSRHQIDFIVCRRNTRSLLTDSRAYPGTLYKSDHSITVVRLSISKYIGRGQLNKQSKDQGAVVAKYRLLRRELLVGDRKKREEFKTKVADKLSSIKREGSPDRKWNEGIEAMLEVAVEVAGIREKTKNRRFIDEEIMQLSTRHAELRREILKPDIRADPSKLRKLKAEANAISHKRRKRLKLLESQRLDQLAERVEQYKGGAKMFAAIKVLKEEGTSTKAPLIVHDENGQTIQSEQEAANAIAGHFQGLFSAPDAEPLPMFDGTPRPLSRRITADEVFNVVRDMKSGKAIGPDGLPIEVLKAGGKEVAAFVAEVLNESYSLHKSVGLGDGILRALQKAGKQAGPLANLRPIVLLTLLRKVLSLVVLRRIRDKVDIYLSASQAGFRRGRSTSDIIWAYRWLAGKATRYQKVLFILGLDMSRAFDTINRAKLMRILREDVKLDEDALRLIQSLLADTNLKVKLGQFLSSAFQTTIGTPQGDGLSPILFAIYLECALREVRELSQEKRPLPDKKIPIEAIYADDTDFISSDLEFLDFLKNLIPPTIARYDLNANEKKWALTTLERNASKGVPASWRQEKKLGSLLGDEEDVQNRMVRGTLSFKSLRLLWERKKVTSIDTRMRAYNAFVLPVILYNCGTWGVTDAVIEKLEVYHRRQLREVLGIRKRELSNEELYKRCGTNRLKGDIAYARWSLFGHVLRLDRETPAQKAMDYYVELGEGEKEPLGKQETTLPVLLFSEYRGFKAHERGGKAYQKSKERMLTELRVLASDKPGWGEFICNMRKFILKEE